MTSYGGVKWRILSMFSVCSVRKDAKLAKVDSTAEGFCDRLLGVAVGQQPQCGVSSVGGRVCGGVLLTRAPVVKLGVIAV